MKEEGKGDTTTCDETLLRHLARLLCPRNRRIVVSKIDDKSRHVERDCIIAVLKPRPRLVHGEVKFCRIFEVLVAPEFGPLIACCRRALPICKATFRSIHGPRTAWGIHAPVEAHGLLKKCPQRCQGPRFPAFNAVEGGQSIFDKVVTCWK